KELKIGNGSFNGYPVCEIDSLNSLEVIEIGGFRYASDFQLKNLPELTSLVIGCGCLQNVGELKLIGLKKLEKVMIGEKCFMRNDYSSDPNRQFCLKECDALRELKIGNGSFNDYSVCE
ncbi:hypothetical protein WA556_001849, partial [Blastocystis sp. ATCC 50177/Nand II]